MPTIPSRATKGVERHMKTSFQLEGVDVRSWRVAHYHNHTEGLQT